MNTEILFSGFSKVVKKPKADAWALRQEKKSVKELLFGKGGIAVVLDEFFYVGEFVVDFVADLGKRDLSFVAP